MDETKYSHDVFISFAFKDQVIVDKIVNHLTNLYGISCWICTAELRSGHPFSAEIAQAIRASRLVVFVQSKSSSVSDYVTSEIAYALEYGKTVMPFIIEESKLNDELELRLIRLHYIDATKPTLDERIKELASDICNNIKKPFAGDKKTVSDGSDASTDTRSRAPFYWIGGASLAVLAAKKARAGKKKNGVKYKGATPRIMLENIYLALKNNLQWVERKTVEDLRSTVDSMKYSKEFGISKDANVAALENEICQLIEELQEALAAEVTDESAKKVSEYITVLKMKNSIRETMLIK